MPYADNEGIRIHYRTEGEGPPVVLHHWSLATMEDWYDYGYVSALKNDYRRSEEELGDGMRAQRHHSPLRIVR